VKSVDTADYLQTAARAALRHIAPADREKLAELILSSQRTFVFGAGRSGLIGQTFAVRLVQLGLHVYFIGDMTTPIIAKNDLTLLISNTGTTMSVTKTAQIAKRIGSHVACITATKNSPLTEVSDTVILLSPPADEEHKTLAPLGTVFEDATLLFCDCLVPELMKRLHITEEDMRNHHAIWV
jgi:6-phospho-3-hexuloisomerase